MSYGLARTFIPLLFGRLSTGSCGNKVNGQVVCLFVELVRPNWPCVREFASSMNFDKQTEPNGRQAKSIKSVDCLLSGPGSRQLSLCLHLLLAFLVERKGSLAPKDDEQSIDDLRNLDTCSPLLFWCQGCKCTFDCVHSFRCGFEFLNNQPKRGRKCPLAKWSTEMHAN